MYCILTGEIKLHNMPDEEALAQLGFSLQRTAIDLDFNICMYANLPYSGLYNYPLKSLNDGLIPYQITEPPMFDQCHRTFEGLWFRENTWQISNLENTRLPKLQEFYTDVMKNTDIEYMTVYFETVHGDADMKPFDMEVKADEICEALTKAPNEGHYEFPPVRLKIVR